MHGNRIIMRPTPPPAHNPDTGMPVVPYRPPSMTEFRKRVLEYYRNHGRDLPWRATSDPYAVLVSEIMLQQTQVGRVVVKFPEFLAAFPDFPSLASAELSRLLAVWQGMGYNRRAIALRSTARIVVSDYDGVLPCNPDVLVTFPGIGNATAHSICAFAFNYPAVFIETNIRRVFIHCFFRDRETVTDAEILPLVRKALNGQEPRIWYNALMDLGTAFGKGGKNPNRKSRHYSRQSRFQGSDREIRGTILRILLTSPGLDLSAILRHCPAGQDRVGQMLDQLVSEGFLEKTGSAYSIVAD